MSVFLVVLWFKESLNPNNPDNPNVVDGISGIKLTFPLTELDNVDINKC